MSPNEHSIQTTKLHSLKITKICEANPLNSESHTMFTPSKLPFRSTFIFIWFLFAFEFLFFAAIVSEVRQLVLNDSL